ncbi:MAG: 2-hydroxyacyl-CoA dehydratase family protein, partial [Pseudomonadota bacterium]
MDHKRIGFTCAHTPVPVIEAAGFLPFRVFPSGDSPDQAGHLLHDNLCPHVKRVLDRALAGDLPDLDGMVFMNSCDAMRRLADAWLLARPGDRVMLLDLPPASTDSSISFLAGEYRRMAETLFAWNPGKGAFEESIQDQLSRTLDGWNRLAGHMALLEARLAQAYYPGLAS